jgi:hypothetical protein
MRYFSMPMLLLGALVTFFCSSTTVRAGEIQIHMYSLPSAGVTLRVDTPIKVSTFATQTRTDVTPLVIGTRRLDIRAREADENGIVTGGIATFSIPDSFYRDGASNVPISFAFEIGNTRVQTVLGAVVPKNGRVEMHVVVPNPTPQQSCPCWTGPRRCCGTYAIKCGSKR